jgi:ribosome-binding protein aMBF1 (putative translation factor)
MRYDIQKLERARILKGWNKAFLAKIIEVDPAVIGRVEKGENTNVVTVKKMADALGLTMEDLLIEDEDEPTLEHRTA